MKNIICVSIDLNNLEESLREEVSSGSLLFKWTKIIEDTVRDEPFKHDRLLTVLPVRYDPTNGSLVEALLLFVPEIGD